MSGEQLEAFRILGLILLVWFGLVGWKLIPPFWAMKSRTVRSNLGGR